MPGAVERVDDVPNMPRMPATTTGNTFDIAQSAWAIAHRVAGTEFVPAALRGKPEATLACMLFGHEAGVGPMQSLSKIHVIEGRPAMAAELMRALVLNAGHDIWVEESTTTRVTVCGHRSGTPENRVSKVTWTMDDAKRAGLDGRQNWRKYPRAMLLARATAELVRAMFPDVTSGISHTIEELQDGDVAEPEPVAEVIATVAPAETPDPPVVIESPMAADDGDVIDAEVVEIVPDPVPDEPVAVAGDDPGVSEPETGDGDTGGPRLTGPQMLALRFQNAGITDRGARLSFVSEIVGRTVRSGNDLTADEIRQVVDVLDSDGATVAAVGTDPGGPEVDAVATAATGTEAASPARAVPPPTPADTDDPEVWTGDDWRAAMKANGGVIAAVLLQQARDLSGLKVGTLDDIAGLGIAAQLREWLIEQ